MISCTGRREELEIESITNVQWFNQSCLCNEASRTSLVAQMAKNLLACWRAGFNPWVRKIPWRREWLPTPIFLPGESYRQRNLVGYSPWGLKESETTKQLTLSTFSMLFINIFTSFSSLHEVNKVNSLSILFSGGRDWFYRLVYFAWGHSEQTLSDSITYILAVLQQLRLQPHESRKQVQPSRHRNAHKHE